MYPIITYVGKLRKDFENFNRGEFWKFFRRGIWDRFFALKGGYTVKQYYFGLTKISVGNRDRDLISTDINILLY